ncbi:MAG: hypothetical protein H0U50_08490 [Pyrinomonadaceae bacterium]|nr:hypothetical protein [Pyrinomonadaceae bacterium]
MKVASCLLTVAFVFVICFSQTAVGQNRTVINEAERITNDRFAVSLTTPKGARIYAVNRPNARMLNAIDDGLGNLFAIAGKNNYSRRLNYSDYTIFIAKADRTQDSKRQYSPDIAVGAAQYAGSIYDQGGYVYAAGMVITLSPCAFVIAEHTKNFERVSNVVRYEGEHLVLYHNNRRLYNQTADHSQGGGHPILQ